MASVRLPEDIEEIINIELQKVLINSPERKALMDQIQNRHIYHPLFGLPQALHKLYFGDEKKTDDAVFAKPYWYCELRHASTQLWGFDFPSRRLPRRSLLRRLINDGVIVGSGFANGVVLNPGHY